MAPPSNSRLNPPPASMKVPPKRKGNGALGARNVLSEDASMKVPPKRKGNENRQVEGAVECEGLNESPSEKEGK